MKTRNVFSYSLLSFAFFQAHATDFPAPLYESVLSADISQLQRQDPVQLTQKAVMKQSLETMRNRLVVRDSHVVMVAEFGVTVLERTAQGLVRRNVLEFDSSQLYSDTPVFASEDGKKIVWFFGNQQLEVDIANDFTASVKKQTTNSQYYQLLASDNPSEFVGVDSNSNQFKVMRIASNGLKELASLPVTDELNGSFMLYNSKDQILVSAKNTHLGHSIVVFQLKDGVLTETDRLQTSITDHWYLRGYVYDVDTARLIIHSPYNRAVEIPVDKTSGKLGAISEKNENLVSTTQYSDFSFVISGDVAIARSYSSQDLVLQRDGVKFRQVVVHKEYNSERVYVQHRNASGKTEVWQNSNWSLQQYELEAGQPVLKQSRGSLERGLPRLSSDGLVSDDSRFWLHQDNDIAVVVGMDANKMPQVMLEIPRFEPNSPLIPYNAQFIKVSTGTYLLAGYSQYQLLTEDSNGKLSISAPKNWPQPLDTGYSNFHVKSKNGQIFLSKSGLHVLQVSNNGLSVVTSLQKDNKLTDRDRLGIRAVVELKGQLYALMPDTGKTAQLNLQDGKLTAVSTGAMPVFDGRIIEGRDRVFTNEYRPLVLMPDGEGNLRVTAVAKENFDPQLYQQRVQFSKYVNPYDPFIMVNDAFTGVWQNQAAYGDCCDNNVRTRLLAGHLLTFQNDRRLVITNYEINTAPYMPAQIAPLQFNQGVETNINLKSFVQDDEQSAITFSGLSQDAFSLNDGIQLKYKGLATGKGDLLLTVSDGTLKTEIKLPYQINSAPALLKPVPAITANQHASIQFDLNDYIEDPEGSAVSFGAQNAQGFSLSKSGLLSGTATGLSDVSLPLVVTDKAGAQLKTTVTIKVNAAPMLTGSSTASGKVNQSFALDLNTLITDAEKHRITLSAQGLPAGLSLNGAVISGTPTAAGSATVTVTAIDELGARSQLSLSLQIAPEDKKGGGSIGFGLVALLALLGLRRR